MVTKKTSSTTKAETATVKAEKKREERDSSCESNRDKERHNKET